MTHIEHLKNIWITFKEKRNRNAFFAQEDKGFIKVIEREKLIDILFEHIERIENGQKNKKTTA